MHACGLIHKLAHCLEKTSTEVTLQEGHLLESGVDAAVEGGERVEDCGVEVGQPLPHLRLCNCPNSRQFSSVPIRRKAR